MLAHVMFMYVEVTLRILSPAKKALKLIVVDMKSILKLFADLCTKIKEQYFDSSSSWKYARLLCDLFYIL